jgi:acyl-CoA reductase-like NAD-dependent aldehyde dehydrogenase
MRVGLTPSPRCRGSIDARSVFRTDADLDLAVNAALHNKLLFSGGQSCLRSNRIFVHESIVEPFIAALRTQVESLSVVGMGTTGDGEIDLLGEIAPLLDIAAGRQLESLVSHACQQGARVIRPTILVSLPEPQLFWPGCKMPWSLPIMRARAR